MQSFEFTIYVWHFFLLQYNAPPIDFTFYNALRDWSLITGRGGATKREGGAREVLPLRKGGGGQNFSHSEGGGHKKFWGCFYAVD